MKQTLLFEFRKWSGRGGENAVVEIRCRARADADATNPNVVAAPSNAKPHEWRAVNADELALAPEAFR
jgi:hypothetical protein